MNFKQKPKVLHIIPMGEEIEPIMVGIRNYPVSAIAFLYDKSQKKLLNEVTKQLSILGIPIELYEIGKEPLLSVMEIINRLAEDTEAFHYDEILVNVGSATKHYACAAISAAFVNGLRAIHVMEGNAVPLPVLKFSYKELVSPPKMDILRALSSSLVSSLSELSERTNMNKSLLSYHIRGGKESQGLEGLNLIEINRGPQGRLIIDLTPMGRIMLIGRE